MTQNDTEMETSPTIIDFPLRGEWVAEATPAQRVPTHGTDLFGQRYAYDFVGVEGRSKFLRTQGTARGNSLVPRLCVAWDAANEGKGLCT